VIRYIIFDLDGVLVDTKNIHFLALNEALLSTKSKFQIDYLDHLKTFDGLPTLEKLNYLYKLKKIKKNEIEKVNRIKKIVTSKTLKNNIVFNKEIFKLFQTLSKKYFLAIATNSIQETLDTCLKKLKIKKFIKFAISTKKLKYKKPHPEIYLKCLVELGAKPNETLVLEDSHVGRLAAKEAGCNLMPIKKSEEVTLNKIKNFIKIYHETINHKKKYTAWDDQELNILIPMAGAGTRFQQAGYTFPKPLIEIHRKPMIQWVIESLNIKAKYIFIIQSEHEKKYNLKSFLNAISPNCKIVETKGVTEGAACTTLLAKKYINVNSPLIIANSDQYIEWNSSKSMYKFINKNVDAGILVFNSHHPKWSYAKNDDKGYVTEVAEKKVISNNATVGIYYWKKGSDYVKYAEQMIKKNIRVNNEFYVCPVFNQGILENKKIITENIEKMWGLGTPEDLDYFVQNFNFLST